VGDIQDSSVAAMNKEMDFCQIVMGLLTEVRDEQRQIRKMFDEGGEQFRALEKSLHDHAEESDNRHAQILGAFPAQDTDGHRRYHESQIEKIELRNRMIRECLVLCAKTGGLAGAGWLMHAVWIAIKSEFLE